MAVAGIIREVCPSWQVTSFEVHGQQVVDQIDEYYGYIRSADIILSHPVHTGYRARVDLSVDWVRENLKSSAQLVVIPAVHFSAHHPGLDALPLTGHTRLTNILAAHLAADGHTPSQCAEILLDENLLTDADIEAEIRATILETKRREVEDLIDVPISPFLERISRSRNLFHIQNHPYREVSVTIVNDVFRLIGEPIVAEIDGFDYQNDLHIPPLPSISRFLMSNGATEADSGRLDLVRLHGRPPSVQSEYYQDLVASLACYDPAEIRQAIERRWPTINVLRRLAANRSRIPGIDRWLENA